MSDVIMNMHNSYMCPKSQSCVDNYALNNQENNQVKHWSVLLTYSYSQTFFCETEVS